MMMKNKSKRRGTVESTTAEADIKTINLIAKRAVRLWASAGTELSRGQVICTLATMHRKACPLRLTALLEASDANFAHDIGGILAHFDGEKLNDYFLPRYTESALLRGLASA